ncbi:MAG: hypothetical protein HZA31_08740 [Opitutae bacterium]|nr:hypothetical protein [Opitutae bacterium]
MKRFLPLLLAVFFCAGLLRSAPAPQTAEPFHFYRPDKSWSLDCDLADFTITENALSPDLRSRDLTATLPARGLTLSAALNPARDALTAIQLRDGVLARLRQSGARLSHLKTFEKDDRAYLEYTLALRTLHGAVEERHVHVFFVYDETWIDAHMAQAAFNEPDTARFEKFFASLTINREFQPSTPDVITIGTLLFRRQQFPQAIGWLQRALDREKLKSTLPRAQTVVLIDLLARAQLNNNDRAAASATYQHGLTAVPNHPVFHYGLACIHGKAGELDDTLKHLRLALLHRGQLAPGEKLANPAGEPSFQAFLRQPRFQKVVEEFAKATPPAAI